MSLCLAAAGIAIEIAASTFTLTWTHTIEKTLWRETWRVDADRLVLAEARVKGSGAGMEPPPDAWLVDGAYVWQPNEAHAEIVLRRDPHADDWRLCAAGRCDALEKWLGADTDPVRLSPGPTGCEPDA